MHVYPVSNVLEGMCQTQAAAQKLAEYLAQRIHASAVKSDQSS